MEGATGANSNATHSRGDGNRGRGRGRGGQRSRGQGDGSRGGGGAGRGRGRGGGGGGNRQAPSAAPTNDADKSAQPTTLPAFKAKEGEQQEEDDDAEVCFICANPIVHLSVAPCNHSTCHICSLRLRGLYKSKECPHCRVSTASHLSQRDEGKLTHSRPVPLTSSSPTMPPRSTKTTRAAM